MSRTEFIPIVRSLALSIALGLAGMAFAGYIPGVNGIILGLLLGMLVANFTSLSSRWSSGLSTVSAKGLEWAIIFIAFGIDYRSLTGGSLGGGGILLTVLLIIGTLLLATAIHIRRRPASGKMSWLIGFGTAICGSSAIAALAPSLDADEEDTAISIAVVNLIGTIGMLLLPLVLVWAATSERFNALFIGSGLHSIGNVGGAGFAMGAAVGELAIAVKMARVAMLSPILILLNLLIRREQGLHWKEWIRLPWYLIVFILISIAVSTFRLPETMLTQASTLSKLFLTVAMTAIGLRIDIASLFRKAKRGIGFGLWLFALQLLTLGIWLRILL